MTTTEATATNATRIAVVDDDPVSRLRVGGYLEDSGYAVLQLDGGAALRAAIASTQPPALVLLDLRMPGEDGLSLLRWLRATSDLPVIMLTSADDTADRVVGLEMGADDYLAKPCELRELLARVRSVLRRHRPQHAAAAAVMAAAPAAAASAAIAPAASTATAAAPPPGPWFGRWRLDRARRRLVDSGGEVLAITGADHALLSVFADHPNVVLSREKLLELSGTDPAEVFDRAVDLRITRLRRKIEPVPGDPTVIRTVRGHGGGYEFVPSDGPSYGR